MRCLGSHEAIVFTGDLVVTCILAKSENEMGLLVWGRIGKLVLE